MMKRSAASAGCGLSADTEERGFAAILLLSVAQRKRQTDPCSDPCSGHLCGQPQGTVSWLRCFAPGRLRTGLGDSQVPLGQ